MAAGSGGVVDVSLSAGGVPTNHPPSPASTTPYAVAFANIDTDEIPDLVIANYAGTAGSVWVRKGLGGGVFNASTASTIATGNGTLKVAPVDLDLDGDLDVVIANYTANTIQVLRNTKGALVAETAIAMSVTAPPDVP